MEYIGFIGNDHKLLSSNEIVIFGAGKNGKNAYEIMRNMGIAGKVVLFADSNEKLHGKYICDGVGIVSLAQATKNYPMAEYLVTGVCVRQMCELLIMHDIKKIHVIRAKL